MLKLSRTAITGKGIERLNTLKSLKQINLVSSNFLEDHLEPLYSFPALERVYLFAISPQISSSEITLEYQSIFDMGNYKLDEEVEETL